MKSILKFIVVKILKLEAKLVLRKYKPKIVAITGSVGKTSTKDAVYASLAKFFFARKSEKSFNSEVGLPLTILGCPNGWSNPIIWLQNFWKGLWLLLKTHSYPKWLVLEVGAGKPGDIKNTAKWLHPDIVIMTKFSETPVHVEFFKSVDHLFEEKSSLALALKLDGVLILNTDDDKVMSLKQKTKNRVITYGFSEGADLSASNTKFIYDQNEMPKGITFKLNYTGNSLPVVLNGVFGEGQVNAALAALAVIYSENLNIIEAVEALKDYDLPPGRLRLIDGIKKSLIIDDTYNSSPIACEAALTTLKNLKVKGRKIAVLGDMLELGKHTEEAHKKIGKIAVHIADILIVIGLRAKFFSDGARETGMDPSKIYTFKESYEAGNFLLDFISSGDIILIKGSQGTRLERVVKMVMAHPEQKESLLCRQDPEWKKII